MASPCEVLIDTDVRETAEAAFRIAETEAQRVEAKFSRYRADNIVHRINHAGGEPITVDDETTGLINYAATCYETSDGLFDITSGALRRAWTFDGGDRVPTDDAVREALRDVGWDRVTWEDSTLVMPEGMEIDLGGIGKEYAVDRVAGLIAGAVRDPFLVNFGGDLWASGSRRGSRAWIAGIDDPGRPGEAALYKIELH